MVTGKTEEMASFMRAICEDVHSDAPRLIFADWLDENGEPERAEFIRLQIAIMNRTPPCPSVEEKSRMECLLHYYHYDNWGYSIQPYILDYWYLRGFVYRIEIKWKSWERNWKVIREETPLEVVRLVDFPKEIHGVPPRCLGNVPEWEGIRFILPK